MFNNIDEVIDYVKKTKCQSHICVCNSAVFSDTLNHGVYGFPRGGNHYTKSFMRSMSSLYNIGKNDLIFIYRMKEDGIEGNREIHGPFQIYCDDSDKPVIYCEDNSQDMPIKVGKNRDVDCSMRFMFKRITPGVYSIADNFKLIEKYEQKLVWGYRHPAVMNIGAARKKSVSSFTTNSTLEILSLLKREITESYPLEIPSPFALDNYKNKVTMKFTESHLISDKFFSKKGAVNDEAYLYAYLLSAFCANKGSALSNQIIDDFRKINSGINFDDFLANTMLEVILSPHLQDEMDIVLQTTDESSMLFIESKKDLVDQWAIDQAKRYIDLLQSIFPKGKNAYANIIGSGIKPNCIIPAGYENKIKLVTYFKTAAGVRFNC